MSNDPTVLFKAFNIRCFGAKGDGVTNNTKSIAAAISACAEVGGGTVYFPAGTYLTGPITMQSHMTLYLEAGSTILGSPVFDDYPRRELRLEGTTKDVPSPLIFAENAENIAVKGDGTIDGNGSAWWDKWTAWYRTIGLAHEKGIENLTPQERAEFDEAEQLSASGRPRLVEFVECNRVLIDGVTLQNSPMWTLHPLFCENVTVNNVRLLNPPHSPNTDGINPDSCKYVRITNCHIDVGDDCITIKSGLDEEGRRKRNMETVRWNTGDGIEVIAVYGPLHDGRGQWRPKKGLLERISALDVITPVRVKLPEARHVTVVGSDRKIGSVDEFTIQTRPWQPVFAVLSVRPLQAPMLKPSTQTVKPGETVGLTVALPDAQGLHALKVRVTSPDGAAAEWFDQSMIVGGELAQLSLPLAHNETSGEWKIEVVDLYNGMKAVANFKVPEIASKTWTLR